MRGNWPDVRAIPSHTTTASSGSCGGCGPCSTRPSDAMRSSTTPIRGWRPTPSWRRSGPSRSRAPSSSSSVCSPCSGARVDRRPRSRRTARATPPAGSSPSPTCGRRQVAVGDHLRVVVQLVEGLERRPHAFEAVERHLQLVEGEVARTPRRGASEHSAAFSARAAASTNRGSSTSSGLPRRVTQSAQNLSPCNSIIATKRSSFVR